MYLQHVGVHTYIKQSTGYVLKMPQAASQYPSARNEFMPRCLTTRAPTHYSLLRWDSVHGYQLHKLTRTVEPGYNIMKGTKYFVSL
jgi:hypothetical protein